MPTSWRRTAMPMSSRFWTSGRGHDRRARHRRPPAEHLAERSRMRNRRHVMTLWKSAVRAGLALAMLLGLAGPMAGLDGARAQGAAPVKKIVFWAGPKEHGAPGRHEYERDLTELAWQLEHATNLHGVKTVVKVVTKPPRDISELEDADALVIFGNGAWLR